MKRLTLLVKPASSLCDLRCRYCFYHETARSRSEPNRGVMTGDSLALLFERIAESVTEQCTVVFQGGEPTLAGPGFFREAVRLRDSLSKRGPRVDLGLQTNGLHLDAGWCAFLASGGFLTGLSLDGPAEIHDAHRVGPDGKGSFARAMRAAGLLERAGAPFNILSVVTDASWRRAAAVYGFFRRQGFAWLQFIPCLGDAEGRGALSPERYAHFLTTLFDLWVEDVLSGRGTSIRLFDNWTARLLGQPGEMCGMNGSCSLNLVVEADGSVYPCDFYCDDAHRLGDLQESSLEALANTPTALAFLAEGGTGPDDCLGCPWRGVCGGGCRRYREGPEGLLPADAYCAAYKAVFESRYERLRQAADLLSRTERYPAPPEPRR